jgi:phosphoserine phosphatase
MIARGKFFSMEMKIDTQKMKLNPTFTRWANLVTMKDDLRSLCTRINQSVVVQSENIYQRKKKLVVFDVESSLIQQDSLRNFISTIKGKVAASYSSTDLIENKEDQMHQLEENAKSLRGLHIDSLKKFSEILQLNSGTYELIRILKSMGFKIALLSSGFGFFVKKIFENAGVDYAFSNTLAVDENGITTGELAEPVINSGSKDEMIEFIMKNENIERDQVIAVGDGSKSAHFISNAGLSITFKPGEPDSQTDGVLSNDKVIDVLYCLGIPKEEVDKYF